MSVYEREDGQFVLPSDDYAAIRDELFAARARRTERSLDVCRRYCALVVKEAGVAGEAWPEAHRRLLNSETGRALHRHLDESEREVFWDMFLHNTWRPGAAEASPTPEVDYAIGSENEFRLSEARITFNDPDNTIHWDVPDNNHAVDRAHEHPLAALMFERLRGIRHWPEGTGGFLNYRSEYDRDTSRRSPYGPLGEAAVGFSLDSVSSAPRF